MHSVRRMPKMEVKLQDSLRRGHLALQFVQGQTTRMHEQLKSFIDRKKIPVCNANSNFQDLQVFEVPNTSVCLWSVQQKSAEMSEVGKPG